MFFQLPNKGEQLVRYYGYYSNLAEGKRKKVRDDDKTASILEPVESLKVKRPELSDRDFCAQNSFISA